MTLRVLIRICQYFTVNLFQDLELLVAFWRISRVYCTEGLSNLVYNSFYTNENTLFFFSVDYVVPFLLFLFSFQKLLPDLIEINSKKLSFAFLHIFNAHCKYGLARNRIQTNKTNLQNPVFMTNGPFIWTVSSFG